MALAQDGWVDVVDVLIQHGANVNACTRSGFPLMEAVRFGKVDIVDRLLQAGADPNMCDEYTKVTPLLAACLYGHGHLGIVQKCVNSGASVDVRESRCGNTPLIWASCANNIEIVDFLISLGIDLDQQNDFGYTALMEAVWENHLEVVKSLIEAGADRNLQNQKGETALAIAEEKEFHEIVKLIREYETSP